MGIERTCGSCVRQGRQVCGEDAGSGFRPIQGGQVHAEQLDRARGRRELLGIEQTEDEEHCDPLLRRRQCSRERAQIRRCAGACANHLRACRIRARRPDRNQVVGFQRHRALQGVGRPHLAIRGESGRRHRQIRACHEQRQRQSDCRQESARGHSVRHRP